MTLGKRMLGLLLAVVILVAGAAPSRAQGTVEEQILNELQKHIIDVYTFEGVLGTVSESQITVVNEANTVVPIIVPAPLKLDPQYIVGNRVWVELEKSKYMAGVWTLRKIHRIDTEGSVTPTVAP